jgi:hypothetical protein
MRPRVYIAGPMTRGDKIDNLAGALKTYRTLMAAGFAPICPQLTYFAEPFVRQTHTQWLEADLPWVDVSDALLRLPGESLGADLEEGRARVVGVPVFDSVEALFHHFGAHDE